MSKLSMFPVKEPFKYLSNLEPELDSVGAKDALTSLVGVYLYVDWIGQAVYIKDIKAEESIPFEALMGLITIFKLPDNINFLKFQSFFEQEIRPRLVQIALGFRTPMDFALSFATGSYIVRGSFSPPAEQLIYIVSELVSKKSPTISRI